MDTASKDNRYKDRQDLLDGVGDRMVIDSQVLLGNRNEVDIWHEGQIYRLRVTRHGKLILNK